MTNVLVTGANGQLGSEIKALVESREQVHGTEGSGQTHEQSREQVHGTEGSGQTRAQSFGTEGSGQTYAQRFGTEEGRTLSVPRIYSGLGAYKFFFADRATLDITDKKALAEYLSRKGINTIINCAAYTAVDKAEEDAINADTINHLAVKNLAEISKEKNIKLIHISTDYVFDGTNFKPYTEEDTTHPNGVYGKTKLDGERALLHVSPPHSIIIRTSWVYSSFGANFVKTMLRLGKEKKELGVIYDQVGTPTYARDLAKTILDILPNIKNEKVAIYNYSNEGVVSWYDFAKEIMRMAKLDCQVNPIETKDYPTPAKRPHYSLLNKSKIKKEFGITIPYWKDSLDACLKVMGERR